MAGWVIDQCVKDERIGGAITKNLKHATDWILDPASDFFDDRMRKFLFSILSLHNTRSHQPQPSQQPSSLSSSGIGAPLRTRGMPAKTIHQSDTKSDTTSIKPYKKCPRATRRLSLKSELTFCRIGWWLWTMGSSGSGGTRIIGDFR